MPKTEVVFYQEANGNSPIVDWLEELRSMDAKAYAKCVAMVEGLAEIERARTRKKAFEANPEQHTYAE